jgi:hypothetical protein
LFRHGDLQSGVWLQARRLLHEGLGGVVRSRV